MVCLILFVAILKDPQAIDSSDLKTRYVHLEDFGEVAEIDSLIQLETNEKSVLGQVNRVLLDPRRKRLFVVDIGSNLILVFRMDGTFLGQFSRTGSGPGEFEGRLLALGKFSNGNMVLMSTHQLILFGPQMEYLKSIKTRDLFLPKNLVTWNDRVFVKVSLDFGKNPKTVFTFNENLDLVERFHSFDKRHQKYLMSPLTSIELYGNKLLLNPSYKLGFFLYDIDDLSTAPHYYRFPSSNDEILRKLWSTKPSAFNEDTRRDIRRFLHRFPLIQPFGHMLMMFEFRKAPTRINKMYGFSNPNQLTIFSGYHFFNHQFKGASLLLEGFAGSWEKGTIGVLEFDEHFNTIKKKYPQLRRVNMNEGDNPVLLLMKPKLEQSSP